jgi:hypothetical protein
MATAALWAGAATAPASSPRRCAATAAHRSLAPILALDPKPRAVRVFAMQFKQEARHVASLQAFREKIDCMIQRYVAPHLARGRPNVVAFTEDIGLATVATGSRGRAARALAAHPASAPGCAGQGFPCATLATLAELRRGYAREIAYYGSRFPTMNALSSPFIAATDTFVRGFMQTFSDLARRYRVYILGSSDQTRFRVSRAPADVAALADPDARRPPFVYVASDDKIYNEVFLWGPSDVRRSGPGILRNLLATNRKVPLTPIEQALGFTPGPSTGQAAIANLRPYHIPRTRARLGFATSLPAFTYGPASPGHECDDTSRTYMRCLDALGTNLVMQDEANPGPWTGPDGDGIEQWQPMSWMSSTWRAVADPTVHFDYNVTPMMVGNLADLTFDGQSAITQRGLRGRGCHYIGNARFVPGEDRPDLLDDAGPKPQFLALAPWVASDRSRAALRTIGRSLAPGSGTRLENDYLETALIADLPFPRDPRRASCQTR